MVEIVIYKLIKTLSANLEQQQTTPDRRILHHKKSSSRGHFFSNEPYFIVSGTRRSRYTSNVKRYVNDLLPPQMIRPEEAESCP